MGAVDVRRSTVRERACARSARSAGEGRAVAAAADVHHRRVHDHDQVLDAGRRQPPQFQGAGRRVRQNGPRSRSLSRHSRRQTHASSLLLPPGTFFIHFILFSFFFFFLFINY